MSSGRPNPAGALRLVATAALLAAVGACFVSFDPDGQPCDSKHQCLAGYACDVTANACHKSGTTGGTGSTSGTGASGSSGTHGSTSGSSGGTSGGHDCSSTVCPAAQACQMRDGGPSCTARVPTDAGAATCTFDDDCGTGGYCLISSASGAVGFCTRDCSLAQPGTCGSGAACQSVTGVRGNTFALCVPTPAPKACTSNAVCGAGLSCLELSKSSAPGEQAAAFCDTAASGAANGAACASGAFCQSGICAALGDGGGACLAICAASSDCATGFCSAVRHLDTGTHTRACVTGGASACGACTACGADAPDCEAAVGNGSTGTCVQTCSAGEVDACGHGRTCLPAGYCAVDGGACP